MAAHPIVHVELTATDQAALTAFYSGVFDWQMNYHPEFDYTTFDAEGGPGGGFNPVQEDNPVGTIRIYIQTDDIDATLRQIEQHGGKCLQAKMEIPGTGWFAHFQDPAGNVVSLYTPLPAA